MVLSKYFRNTYEESPDRLKELIEHVSNEKGQKPKSKLSLDSLLKLHEQHLKWIVEGDHPSRNFILPSPYPPSQVSIRNACCKWVQIDDLLVESRLPDQVLLLHTLATPYVYSSTVTIVEDESGNSARLTICNLEDTVIDPLMPKNSVIAIKQPCWSRLVEGGYHIRVDQPSDLVILSPDDELVKEQWKKAEEVQSAQDPVHWRKEGDMMFLKKQFRKALQLYDRGLGSLAANPDPAVEIDLYRKRCGVNIVLLRLEDAAKDLSRAISIHAKSNNLATDTDFTNASVVESWLHNRSTDSPIQSSADIPQPLKELANRIKFDLGVDQDTPNYNFPVISTGVGPLNLHVDAPNYLCETEIRQTASHGRGLFAKRSFKTGELIAAEKAFVLPGYFPQDPGSSCSLYNLGDESAASRPGALLYKELVQKLKWNPPLRKDFFDLDDGGYWKKYGWEIAEGEIPPLDVFRVEFIRRYNCFSAPTRSSELLSQPPNRNNELRNGFWNHASYVNHSCIPNSVRTFIGDIHFLRATREIAAGEEITNQYVSPEIDISDRQEKYRGTWAFECDCKLCEVDGAISEDVRQERKSLFEELKNMVMQIGDKPMTVTTIKKIARGVRKLEALYSPAEEGASDSYDNLPRLALVHPNLFLTEAWRGVKNVDRMIEYATKLLRNFGIVVRIEGTSFDIVNEAGLVNVEAVRALKYLAEGYTQKGEQELANAILELAKNWYTVITGASMGAEEFFRF